MKSIAIIGLALTGTALSRRTPHTERLNQLKDIVLDDADNQLHSYFSMSNNQGSIQFNDYTVHRDASDESELFKVSPTWAKVNQQFQIQRDDEIDNELHSYFSMPNNQGNIQFNDYTVHRDAADNELRVPVRIPEISAKTNQTKKIQNDDEIDNELHNYYSYDKTFNVIDHGILNYDDEFALTAAGSQKFTKDEIETLASILKLATQDKDGNVMVDGVKVGKMPKREFKKVEVPKKRNFLGH